MIFIIIIIIIILLLLLFLYNVLKEYIYIVSFH